VGAAGKEEEDEEEEEEEERSANCRVSCSGTANTIRNVDM